MEILQKDAKNLVSKQIFARWLAILSKFDFEINFIKGKNNSLLDFWQESFYKLSVTKHISYRSHDELEG